MLTTVKSVLEGYAEDLNDPLYKTWTQGQLLRYHNEGICMIAGIDPSTYTKIKTVILPANETTLPKNCECRKFYRVIGEVDKYGIVDTTVTQVNKQIYASFREPAVFKQKRNPAAIQSFTIDSKTNTVSILPSSTKDRSIQVECAYLPQHVHLEEVIEGIMCTHLGVLRQYVLAQAKMMDIVGLANNQDALIHFKLFTEMLSLLIGADNRYVKEALTKQVTKNLEVAAS